MKYKHFRLDSTWIAIAYYRDIGKSGEIAHFNFTKRFITKYLNKSSSLFFFGVF